MRARPNNGNRKSSFFFGFSRNNSQNTFRKFLGNIFGNFFGSIFGNLRGLFLGNVQPAIQSTLIQNIQPVALNDVQKNVEQIVEKNIEQNVQVNSHQPVDQKNTNGNTSGRIPARMHLGSTTSLLITCFDCNAYGDAQVLVMRSEDGKPTSADVEFRLKGSKDNGMLCVADTLSGNMILTEIDEDKKTARLQGKVVMELTDSLTKEIPIDQPVPYLETRNTETNETHIHSDFSYLNNTFRLDVDIPDDSQSPGATLKK